jgi:hypothetical protein
MESQPDNTRARQRQSQHLIYSASSQSYFSPPVILTQGFAVSDDEIQMDLAIFRGHYANNGGSVE